MIRAFREHDADLVGPWRSIIQEQFQVINAYSNN